MDSSVGEIEVDRERDYDFGNGALASLLGLFVLVSIEKFMLRFEPIEFPSLKSSL